MLGDIERATSWITESGNSLKCMDIVSECFVFWLYATLFLFLVPK